MTFLQEWLFLTFFPPEVIHFSSPLSARSLPVRFRRFILFAIFSIPGTPPCSSYMCPPFSRRYPKQVYVLRSFVSCVPKCFPLPIFHLFPISHDVNSSPGILLQVHDLPAHAPLSPRVAARNPAIFLYYAPSLFAPFLPIPRR